MYCNPTEIVKKRLTTQKADAIMKKQSRKRAAENADMAELADALDSGSSEFTLMQVQVLLSAPRKVRTPMAFGLFF